MTLCRLVVIWMGVWGVFLRRWGGDLGYPLHIGMGWIYSHCTIVQAFTSFLDMVVQYFDIARKVAYMCHVLLPC